VCDAQLRSTEREEQDGAKDEEKLMVPLLSIIGTGFAYPELTLL
jgi:hypothetical protein